MNNAEAIANLERNLNQEFSDEKFNDILYLVKFIYDNPYPNFNRSKVFGKFSTLFKVKEPEKYCIGLA